MVAGITCHQLYHCFLIIWAMYEGTLALCTISESRTEESIDYRKCRTVFDGDEWGRKCKKYSKSILIGPTTFSCYNSSFQEMLFSYNENDLKIHFIVKNSSLNSLMPNENTWSRLTELTLDNGNISTIIPGFFNGFTELSLLNITNNNISDIVDGVFSQLKHLQILNLTRNSIYRLRVHAFLGLAALKMLDLSKNKILILPENIFLPLNNSLTYLDLSENNNTQLGNTLKLSNIQNMYLQSTNLTNIDFSNITTKTLKALDISHNKLTSVNNFELLQAEIVNLSFNNITSLKKIGKISTFNVSRNRLKLLPGYFASESISELDLSFNAISNISSEAFTYATKLKTLNLSHNILKVLQTNCFRNLDSLEYLDLSYNNIFHLEFGTFDNVKILKYLNISHNNGLVDFHVFLRLSSLENVDFKMNEIKNFDDFFFQTHTNLKHVRMGGNSWKCGELASIIHLMELKNISVATGNSLDSGNIHGIACYSDLENITTEKPDVNTTLQENTRQGISKGFNDGINNATNLKYFNDVVEKILNRTEKLLDRNVTLASSIPLRENFIESRQGMVNTTTNIPMNINLGICNILLLLLVSGVVIIIIHLRKLRLRIRNDEVELMQCLHGPNKFDCISCGISE